MCGTDLVRGNARSCDRMGLDAAVDRNRVPRVEVARVWLAFTALSAYSVGLRMWSKLREKERKDEDELAPPRAVVVGEAVPVEQCGDGSCADAKLGYSNSLAKLGWNRRCHFKVFFCLFLSKVNSHVTRGAPHINVIIVTRVT
ncbi:uncharacterized protein LOC118489164 isoform X1 [Helianthus annuus]|uniref:uncharacterized protein LOC118489164 isoform X1 n=1 Tax=Helianthus annuus TaxID=4232 RepID=UPI001652DA3B|nr:uncharacterized protein LOC118489164 isoform X1 [Helianthus annuus]